jgi:hypothetical protein
MWLQAPHETNPNLILRLYKEDDALIHEKNRILLAEDGLYRIGFRVQPQEEDIILTDLYEGPPNSFQFIVNVDETYYIDQKTEHWKRSFQDVLFGTRSQSKWGVWNRLEVIVSQLSGETISKKKNPLHGHYLNLNK